MPGLLPAKRPQKCGISGTWMCRPRRPAQAGRSASEARAWPASARREPGRMPGLSPEKRHMDVPPARRESAGARASAGFARAARRKPGRMPGLSPRQRHMDVPPAQARASGPERERGAGLARVREARAGQDARSLARDHPAEVRDQRHMDVPPAQARASGPERERGAGLARVREARAGQDARSLAQNWGVAKLVRHGILIPAFEGSSPSAPARTASQPARDRPAAAQAAERAVRAEGPA